MKIDISFLQNPSIVVWCRTKKEAQILYENVISFDESIEHQLSPKVESFSRERDKEGMGFRFERTLAGFDVGYARMWFYRRHGYDIVEFNKLVVDIDLGLIESGYSDLNAAVAALF